MNIYYIVLTIAICMLLMICEYVSGRYIEHQTNVSSDDPVKEAILNISSLYNQEKLSVTDLTVTNSFSILPIGSIIMWGKPVAEIPDGWAVCNGQTVNGEKTPDLKGRFILASDGPINKGPGHINLGPGINTNPAGNHTHKMTGCNGAAGTSFWKGLDICKKTHSTVGGGTHSHSVNVKKPNLALGNLYPIFHRLIFIMRVK